MHRRDEAEMLDAPDIPEDLVREAYQDIASIHRWLGDIRFMVRAIRRNPLPVGRILDVGCATGLVLLKISRKLGVEAVGVDVRPRPEVAAPVPILRANACFDALPAADVAFCMHLGHHLSEEDLVRLIRNVGRYCPRFVLLDLVRHSLPLALFRMFVAPLVCKIDAEDGQRSIRRSYTSEELREITRVALAGTQGTFRHVVAPCYLRQVVDITYSPVDAPATREVVTEEPEWVR